MRKHRTKSTKRSKRDQRTKSNLLDFQGVRGSSPELRQLSLPELLVDLKGDVHQLVVDSGMKVLTKSFNMLVSVDSMLST